MNPAVSREEQSLQVRRRRMQRAFLELTPAARYERFLELQREAFELLEASPDGLRHFTARNRHKRRVESPHFPR